MIKLVSILIVSILLVSSCDSHSEFFNGISKKKDAPIVDTVLFTTPTQIEWLDTLIDLGDVKEGVEKQIVYRYKNTGSNPLMLFNVSPSCGCTIADYSHKPLSAGQMDSIVAKFDSNGKDGSYLKNIKVICNTEKRIYNLAFSVTVKK